MSRAATARGVVLVGALSLLACGADRPRRVADLGDYSERWTRDLLTPHGIENRVRPCVGGTEAVLHGLPGGVGLLSFGVGVVDGKPWPLSLGSLRFRLLLRTLDGRRVTLAADGPALGKGAWKLVSFELPPDRDGREVRLLAGEDADAPAAALCFSPPSFTRPETPRKNVVLVSIDTLRADALDEMPNLAAFGKEGRTFGRVYVASNWTLPSHVSLLASLLPWQHQAPALGEPPPFDDAAFPVDSTLLAEAFHAAGYATYAQTEGGFVDPMHGFGRGFEGTRLLVSPAVDPRATLARHLDNLDRFLAVERGARPYFVFLHTYWVHDYFANLPRWRAKLRPEDRPLVARGNLLEVVTRRQQSELPPGSLHRLYEGGLASTDDFLAQVVARLSAATAPGEQLLVVVTGDHGEAFGEHGVWGHGSALVEEELRVPLVAWSSEAGFARPPVDAPVSEIDIAPSLLAWAGLASPASFAGQRGLFDAWRAGPPVAPIVYSSFWFGRTAERPLQGPLEIAAIAADRALRRIDHADGVTSFQCGAREDGSGATDWQRAPLAECGDLDEAMRRKVAAETRGVFWLRAAGAARVDLELAAPTASNLVAVVPLAPSTSPLWETSTGRVRWQASGSGDGLALFTAFRPLELRAFTVDGVPCSAMGAGTRLELRPSASEVRCGNVVVESRFLPRPAGVRGGDAALAEQLRALGYLR